MAGRANSGKSAAAGCNGGFVRMLPDPADRWGIAIEPVSRVRRGEHLLVVRGDIIPFDGVVVCGSALVEGGDTGNAQPLPRKAVPGLDALSSGWRVRQGWLVMRIEGPAPRPS